MGWFLRKSFSFGPVRLNLSKSGLGYSVGVKGARVGFGPRGNYIHMGRYGVYYRQSLSPPAPDSQIRTPTPLQPSPQGTLIPTADASRLTDSSAEHLLEYIRGQHAKVSVAPWLTVIAAGVLLTMVVAQTEAWVQAISVVGMIVAYLVMRAYDHDRKRVSLSYRLDETARSRYEGLTRSFQTLNSARCLWRIITSDRSRDPKYDAGAGYVISRKAANIRKSPPPHIQVNVDAWKLGLGDQTLYFFPDRIFVYQGSHIGTIPYISFRASWQTTRFIEAASVPGDARVVDRTWRYTNKRGGPDRRFANNKEIPVVEYAETLLSSDQGFNVVMHVSSVDAARQFVGGVTQYCSAVSCDSPTRPVEGVSTPDEQESGSAASGIVAFGWVAAPILLVAMLFGLWLGPRATQPSPLLPIPVKEAGPSPQSKLPRYRVLGQKGPKLIIGVPIKTSDADLLSLLSNFREEIQSQRFDDLGMHRTYQKATLIAKPPTFGTILIFRGANSVPRDLTKSDASLVWNMSEQLGTLRKPDGTRAPAFQ